MKNISAWAIRHPVSPVVLFVVLLFIGIVAFIRMPVTLNPDISFPFVHVLVTQPGAAPPEIETQIMQKVEGAVANVGNVKNIISRATEGQALVFVEFQIGTPVDRAVTDVRDAVAKVRGDLPARHPGAASSSASTSTATDRRTTRSAPPADRGAALLVRRRHHQQAPAGVAGRGAGNRARRRGPRDPRRSRSGAHAGARHHRGEVNDQLRTVNIDAAGGRAQVGGSEQSIRVLGEARTRAALADTQIMLPGGRFARLGDIADVHDGIAEMRSLSRLNGRPATTFGVFKAKGASDVNVLNGVEAELAKIKQAESAGDDLAGLHHGRLHQGDVPLGDEALIEGAMLAVLVVFLFLRDWRATRSPRSRFRCRRSRPSRSCSGWASRSTR